MKKSFLGLALVSGIFASQTQAKVSSNLTAVDIQNAMKVLAVQEVVLDAQNLINWQIGDFQKHSVKFLFGAGTSHKEATKEEGNAIWLSQNIDLMGQAQTSEALIDRATGKVLKMIVNGQEQAVGEQEIDIIEQAETSVTVPAGTFECMYIKAVVKADGKEQEVKMWANPIDVNLDGQLKTVIASMFGDVTMELTQFGPRR